MVSWIQNIKEIVMSKDAMNESLEQMALTLFPEAWKPIGSLLRGQEVDTNYESRQNWLRNAEKIYNLALQDIKKSVEISKGNAKTYENIANQQENFSEFIKYAHQIPVYEEILKLIDSLMEEGKS